MGEVLPFRPPEAFKQAPVETPVEKSVPAVQPAEEKKQQPADVVALPHSEKFAKPEKIFTPERLEYLKENMRNELVDFAAGIAYKLYPRMLRDYRKRKEVNQFLRGQEERVMKAVVNRLANLDMKAHMGKDAVRWLLHQGDTFLVEELASLLLENPRTKELMEQKGIADQLLGEPERAFEDLTEEEKRAFANIAPEAYAQRKALYEAQKVAPINQKRKDKNNHNGGGPEGGGGSAMSEAA